MPKVIFESATFADAIKKANAVAPSRGNAFDKAAGILIEIDPNVEPSVTMRATNLDIYYTEWVNSLEVQDMTEVTRWRVPSSLIANVAATLPIGSGKTVSLETVESGLSTHLLLKCGRTKAKINMMDHSYYPEWEVFDPDDLVAIPDLGARISQVEWAADKSTLPINGLYFTGEEIITTDRYKMAVVPLALPGCPEGGVIIPAGILGSVLKQTGEIMLGVTPNQLLLMPNDTTQLRVVRYDATYPRTGGITVRTRAEFIEVEKANLLEIIRRATAFAASDRLPTLRLWIGKEEVAVMIENGDQGTLGDVLEIPGQATHDRMETKFTPKNLAESLEHAPSARVRIGYDPARANSPLYIDGGSGYECWVVCRGDSPTQ